MIKKENRESALLVLIIVLVSVSYCFITFNRQEKRDAYFKEWKEWANQTETSTSIDVSNPNVIVESKNKYFYHYVSFKEFSEVKIPIKLNDDLIKIRDSKHFSIIQMSYKNYKCLLGLVSEQGVLYEADFKEVYDKGCIKL